MGDSKRKLLERDDPGLKAGLMAKVWKWEVRDEALGDTAQHWELPLPCGLVTRGARCVGAGQVLPSSKGAGPTLEDSMPWGRIIEAIPFCPCSSTPGRAGKVVWVIPLIPILAIFRPISPQLPFRGDDEN